MRHMEGSLPKANLAFPDCSAMAAKFRAMNNSAEEQVRSRQHEVTHLVHPATNQSYLCCISDAVQSCDILGNPCEDYRNQSIFIRLRKKKAHNLEIKLLSCYKRTRKSTRGMKRILVRFHCFFIFLLLTRVPLSSLLPHRYWLCRFRYCKNSESGAW
ncbi:unnamed protein product [Lathyrus sativus]|nr:unnamed protein product [Lathyrus sativus]